MHRRRALPRCQHRHALNIGLDRIGQRGRHGFRRDIKRIRRPAIHRQYEGAIPPRRPVILVEQGLQRFFRQIHLPRNAQRHRIAPQAKLIIRVTPQRLLIIPLRARLIASQVTRQRAIQQQRNIGIVERGGLLHQAQGIDGLPHRQHRPPQTGFHPAIIGRDIIRPPKKTDGGTRVVKLQRRLTSFVQRVDIPWITREPRHGRSQRAPGVALLVHLRRGRRGLRRAHDRERQCATSNQADPAKKRTKCDGHDRAIQGPFCQSFFARASLIAVHRGHDHFLP
ncbi:MAG: hypothetical protein B7Z20_01910 [Sphingobium sp. 32-64-5]|nr:MAG: hypothetical protein B7Z20_01910 [Sphingobium sp. 32-64-5]